MRLTCTDGGSDEFWEGRVEGKTLTVSFGKTGTAGQTKVKELASAADAEKELAKLVREKRAKGYVEEGGASAAPPTPPSPPASPAPATPARPFPFLFYGRRPGDWFEGVKRYEIRFAGEASAAGRMKLVEALAPLLEQGGGLEWGPAHAWLFLNENPPVDDRGWEELFARAEAILREIHAVLPIDQAVLLTARAEGNHPWDVWSRTERAVPLPGPPSPDETRVFGRSSDPALSTPSSDPVFDGAVAKANMARRGAAAAQAAAKGGVALVPTNLHVEPMAPDGRVAPVAPVADGPAKVLSVAVSDDGARALLVVARHPYNAVVERDLATGATREVYVPEMVDDRMGAASGVAYAAGGMIGVLTSEHLYVVELTTSSCEYFERVDGKRVYPTLGGRVLCVLGGDNLIVLGIVGNQSKILARVKCDAVVGGDVDGRFVVALAKESLELVNAEPAWEAFARKVSKKRK